MATNRKPKIRVGDVVYMLYGERKKCDYWSGYGIVESIWDYEDGSSRTYTVEVHSPEGIHTGGFGREDLRKISETELLEVKLTGKLESTAS